MTRRVVTGYRVSSPRISSPLFFAVVADLHNGDAEDVLPGSSARTRC